MDIKQGLVQVQRLKKLLFNNDKFEKILVNKISCKEYGL